MRARIARLVAWGQRNPAAASSVSVGAVVALAFVTLRRSVSTSSASPFGITVGILATLALAAVMAYSIRRSRPQVRKWGPSAKYLQVHEWIGGLFCLLVLIHTDLSLPHSTAGWILWGTALWVVVTGAIGMVLQRTLPRLLASTHGFEVNLLRAPELVEQLSRRAAELAVTADPPVAAWYQRHVAGELAALRPTLPFARTRAAQAAEADGAASILARNLAPEALAQLEGLRQLRDGKREIDAHVGVQRVLRGWLALHLPVAVALLLVVVLHIAIVAWY